MIRKVHSAVVAVPLREPAAFATTVVTAREYVLVIVETDEGVGTGVTVGGRVAGDGHVIRSAVEHLAPMVVGENPHAVERIWKQLFEATLLLGRRGAVLRAMSAIDIALWDHNARCSGRPLHQLLGGFRDEAPAYASGGYYREGKGVDGLVAEMTGYVDAGFDAVKMKVGRLSPRDDAERVRAVREAVGPDVRLAVDANNAWPDAKTALAAIRLMEPHDLWWIEEPLMPDDVAGMATIASRTDVPVATGEIEATRWGFTALFERGSCEIAQADATVAGGVTEWLRIAHVASGYAIPIAPHWMANIHVPLVAAIPNGLTVEYFVLEQDVFNFERLVAQPLCPRGGSIPVPDRPGHGIVLDEDAVRSLMVAGELPLLAAGA
jgi:D-arabinonate dehydratase